MVSESSVRYMGVPQCMRSPVLAVSGEEEPGQRSPGARSLGGHREVTTSTGVTL